MTLCNIKAKQAMLGQSIEMFHSEASFLVRATEGTSLYVWVRQSVSSSVHQSVSSSVRQSVCAFLFFKTQISPLIYYVRS